MSLGTFSGVLTMARGRNGDLYGVNGLQRGFRWNGTDGSVEQLGISAPASAPTVGTTAGTATYYVHSIDVIDGGYGYSKEPAVKVNNAAGSLDGAGAAKAKAEISDGRVIRIIIQDYGKDYTSAPTVTVDAPDGAALRGSGATFTVTLTDRLVTDVTVTAGGSGYFGRPRIRFTGGAGGGARAECVVSAGTISSVVILSPGDYGSTPEAAIDPNDAEETRTAVVRAVLRPSIKGKYWCAYRYVDDTAAAAGGPIPSNISTFTEVATSAAVQQFNWSGLAAGETRASSIELWRTTADQALVLYRVTTLASNASSYTDALSDSELANPSRTGFLAMPVVLPNGQPNARRFRIPPQNKSSVVMFQDRAWFGVDAAGRKYDGTSDSSYAEPNTLYFSEIDEPESVPEPNELILQDNVNGSDRITSLLPFGGGMVVFQERHCYRLTYAAQPIIDANFALIAQRGCLNQRCWATHDGVAYVVDSMGMYVLDGSSATPISDGVDTYWSQGTIHFASADKFFVAVDPVTRIARFYFATSAGYPDRALCYHPVTKCWWEERYAQRFGSAEVAGSGGRQRLIVGAQSGSLLLADSGGSDINSSGDPTGVACQFRTSNFPLADEKGDRSLRVLYKPTSASCDLTVKLHYNGSSSARAAAVATDRGTGFTTTATGHAVINAASSRSSLGSATGYAVAMYAGRVDDRSSGGDRHISIDMSVTKPSGEAVTVYGMGVMGAGQ